MPASPPGTSPTRSTPSQWRSGTRTRTVSSSTCATVRRCRRSTASPRTSATINTTATRFFGTRYVYNVTKSGAPSLAAAIDFVGVDASHAGYICNNTAKRGDQEVRHRAAGPRRYRRRPAEQLLPAQPDSAVTNRSLHAATYEGVDVAAQRGGGGSVRARPHSARGWRGGAIVLVLAAGVLAGCSSSGGPAATPRPTGVRIPSPFEVGQQIGLGDISLAVPSFRHADGKLTVEVTATNVSSAPVSIDPSTDFDLFYASRHWPGTVTVVGGSDPAERSCVVCARLPRPCATATRSLWFDGPTSGAPATVVLRGRGT